MAIGAKMLWDRRASMATRATAGAAVAISAGWAWALLDRTPNWLPWLRTLVIVAAVGCLAALLAASLWRPVGRRLAVMAVVLGIVASMAGPVAYAAQTVTTAHTGSVPSAGPATAGGFGGGGMPGGGMPTTFRAGGGSSSAGLTPPSGSRPSAAPSGARPSGAPGGATATGSHGGGFGGQVTLSSAVKRALQADAGTCRWVLATSGSQSAAEIELATGEPVMAIGGFSGEGGNLTLGQFEQYVAAGEIHYYSGSSGGGPGGGNSTSAITSWVKAHYKAVTVGGETFYDLTSPLS